jgi:hypothetical protein
MIKNNYATNVLPTCIDLVEVISDVIIYQLFSFCLALQPSTSYGHLFHGVS